MLSIGLSPYRHIYGTTMSDLEKRSCRESAPDEEEAISMRSSGPQHAGFS
jgi:hypothetical protein